MRKTNIRLLGPILFFPLRLNWFVWHQRRLPLNADRKSEQLCISYLLLAFHLNNINVSHTRFCTDFHTVLYPNYRILPAFTLYKFVQKPLLRRRWSEVAIHLCPLWAKIFLFLGINVRLVHRQTRYPN